MSSERPLLTQLLLLLLATLYVLAAASSDDTTTTTHTSTDSTTTTSTSYVFLQKFPLKNTFNTIFHTEVLVCPQEGFSETDRTYLDSTISSLATDDDIGFAEIPVDFWSTKTANCIEFGYGGALCQDRCCGSPFSNDEKHFPLNARRAVIGNADTTQKSLFLYGTSGNLNAQQARDLLCPTDIQHPSCWSDWKGTDYNPLTNNCNTFTSALLHCVFGLSDKKPNLGPSDMVTVDCDRCPRSDQWLLGTEEILVDVS